MSAAISQLLCFSYMNHSLQFKRRSVNGVIPLSKLSVAMCLKGHNAELSSSGNKASLSYTADLSRLSVKGTANSYSTTQEQFDESIGVSDPVKLGVSEQKRAAKIHDFCLGIPFGGIVLTGGFLVLFSQET
ncbi:hypothetical protein Ancab_003839 [Ancistrocladus abbreviatus]